eukprot:TRINITY_DN953_c0_g3_i2.p1 TRINITY_DN953_c0_g3~~TRINITY_DN953_c0_g3_i2.p1  ORF type:complete len:436 (+),score=38.33 TRINITY_DN953_c0_g3_i2:52-1359(+)
MSCPISIEKPITAVRQKIRFTVQHFDEAGQPVNQGGLQLHAVLSRGVPLDGDNKADVKTQNEWKNMEQSLVLRDENNGTYTVEMTATLSGTHYLSVSLPDSDLSFPNSPFPFYVRPVNPLLLSFDGSMLSDRCSGIAVCNGRVFLSDFTQHQIFVYDSLAGNLVSRFGVQGNSEGEFDGPRGLAVNPQSKELFVADYWNHRIQVFEIPDQIGESIRYKRSWGVRGETDRDLQFPFGLWFDPNPISNSENDDGESKVAGGAQLYVADQYNHRVQVFAADSGEWVKSIGRYGSGESGAGELEYPQGVTCDAGFVYVSDSANHRVQVFHKDDGSFVKTLGNGSGRGPTQLNYPVGLAVDPTSKRLYIADHHNARAQVWNLVDGSQVAGRKFYSKNSQFVAVDVHMNMQAKVLPWDVCIDSLTGWVYVAANCGVQLFQP